MTDKRDNKGRFLTGHKGGPGRPPIETERAYMDATIAACTPTDWARVVKQAVDDSLNDDPKVKNAARNFLLKALLGSSPDILMQFANIELTDRASSDSSKAGAKGSVSIEVLRTVWRDVYGLQLDEKEG